MRIAIAVLLILIGSALRLYSCWCNRELVHGDVGDDASTVWQLVNKGRFFITDDRYLDQHQPLLPLVGAVFCFIFRLKNTYRSLQLTSLLSGITLLFLIYWHTGSLPVLFFAATCYILCDFSGNGSLYMLYALAVYCCFIAMEGDYPWWLRGVLFGIAYMVHHTALCMVVIPLCISFSCNPPYSTIIFIGSFAAVLAPWALRNLIAFGDPFYNVTPLYIFRKAGIETPKGNHPDMDSLVTARNMWIIAARMCRLWIPHNILHMGKKLAEIMGVLFVPFLCGSYFNLGLAACFVMCHIAMFAVYPTVPWRCYVCIVPLMIPVASDFLSCVEWTMLIAMVIWLYANFAMWLATHTHTGYYDGLLTRDYFGKYGEQEWLMWNKNDGIRDYDL